MTGPDRPRDAENPSRRPDVEWVELDGEAVLYDPTQLTFDRLSRGGAAVCAACDGTVSSEQIIKGDRGRVLKSSQRDRTRCARRHRAVSSREPSAAIVGRRRCRSLRRSPRDERRAGQRSRVTVAAKVRTSEPVNASSPPAPGVPMPAVPVPPLRPAAVAPRSPGSQDPEAFRVVPAGLVVEEGGDSRLSSVRERRSTAAARARWLRPRQRRPWR
jgi:hypothetical protein